MKKAFVMVLLAALCLLTIPTAAVAGERTGTGASDFWFAEGNTLPEFQEFICLANTGDEVAHVQFEFQLETGETKVGKTTVDPHSRATVNVLAFVPPGHSGVSTHVQSDVPVVVERPMYFNYRGKWTGGSDSMGQTELEREFYYPEGTTRSNPADGSFEEWLCLQNPSDEVANVTVNYQFPSGGNFSRSYPVAPHSRYTVNVNGEVGPDRDVSLVVISDRPIACERPIYFNYHGTVQDGSTVVGAPEPETRWYFAEGSNRPGFDTYLCVQNPGNRVANVSVTLPSATQTAPRTAVTVQPMSRYTLPLSAVPGASGADFGIVVESDVPVVAERPMYVDAPPLVGGDTAMGVTEPLTEWSFAEGTTRQGFETYLTLLNPNDQPTIAHLRYQFPDGTTQDKTYTVDADSRFTLNLVADIGDCRDVAMTVTTSLPVVCERPMYFLIPCRGSTDTMGYGDQL